MFNVAQVVLNLFMSGLVVRETYAMILLLRSRSLVDFVREL